MIRSGLLLQLDTVEYGEAWELQKALLEARISDTIGDCLILLQHPPTFTYGRRYKEDDFIANREYYENNGFAIYKTDRGGLATYHGPGQAVGYSIMKMSTYTNDYHQYLRMLEDVIIRTLSCFGIVAERNEGYTGVWVNKAKIGFVGVRVALGYTMHGFSLNVNNDLTPFNFITPCGIQGVRITSIQELLNESINVKEVYDKLANLYSDVFQVRLIPVEMKTLMQGIGLAGNYVRV
ncbi:MAG: lipoyl(octanoyl) transferase LipB [Candidatus Brocadiaceae bacterium]|nr:lipoyl(octanoyl) transferase LipB [Candidatus Brocadiaceae bacterium]